MKKRASNILPEKFFPSKNNIQKIIIILGLPRSGTTLAAAIFDAHDETVVCYEPWNRSKEEQLGPRLNPQQLADFYKQRLPTTATTFVIKETSVEIDALTWISSFIEYNCDQYPIKVIWTIRNFSHSYLSLMERGREWWGNQKMAISIASYNNWLTNALRATDFISHLFKASPGLIYSYEALVDNPQSVIRKLMKTCDLAYSEKLINYFEHVTKKNIHGDMNIQKNPGAIQNNSIVARDDEWEKYESELQKSSMHEIMVYLNCLSAELYENKYIETYDQLQCIAAVAAKTIKGKVISNYIAKQMQKKLSIFVIVNQMTEQALNTIYSLSSHHQEDVTEQDYEVIVLEIPSSRPLDKNRLYKMGRNIRYHILDEKEESVAFAVKEGIKLTHSKFISIITDGGMVVTPGVVRAILDAIRLNGNAVVAVPAYDISVDTRKMPVRGSHNLVAQTHLLNSIHWKEDGYRLFDIGIPRNSSNGVGYFLNITESSFLTLPKRLFEAIGIYDEYSHFEGSGYSNLVIFNRVCEQENTPIYLALFEGTFSQYHNRDKTGLGNGSGRNFLSTLARKVPGIQGEGFAISGRRFEVIGRLNRHATPLTIEILKNISKQET
jgi:hypothetical protein